MAKLNVVIPAAAVEVIGEGGEKTKYRKVERAARAGDIVKITDSDAPRYVINGAFYEVTRLDSCGDPQIIDEDGDGYDCADVDYEVYEKVAQQYREVKRPAKVGERIKIMNADDVRYKTGDEFTVEFIEGDEVFVKHPKGTHKGCALILGREYVVLEPIEEPAQPKRLTVGDYAKVIRDNYEHKTGHIVRIIEDGVGGSTFDYKVDCITIGGTGYIAAKNIIRATESEVEAAKQALKLGSFADGGYAVITNAEKSMSLCGYPNGTYVEVRKVDDRGRYALKVRKNTDDGFYGFCDADALRKVTREEYEAAADPRNQFAKGDKVRLISGGGTLGLYYYETGGIYTVSDPKYSTGKIEITGGGQPTAYAKPEQLEKVSAEEFAEIEKWDAISRKVGEFKPGDLIKIKRNITAAGVDSGEISEVKEVNAGAFGNGVRLTKLNPQGIHAWVVYDDIELIVPVEQRFDREEEA